MRPNKDQRKSMPILSISKIVAFMIPLITMLILLTVSGTTNSRAESTHNMLFERYAPASNATSDKPDNQYDSSNNRATGSIGMRNPSAVYCNEMGYEFVVLKATGGERGICVMPDGEECDSWAFYSGECGQDYSYCTRNGLAVSAIKKGDSLAKECTTSNWVENPQLQRRQLMISVFVAIWSLIQ
jgi:putative hemolysin